MSSRIFFIFIGLLCGVVTLVACYFLMVITFYLLTDQDGARGYEQVAAGIISLATAMIFARLTLWCLGHIGRSNEIPSIVKSDQEGHV